MPQRQFTVAELEGLDVRCENVSKEILYIKRWTVVYDVIFEHDGLYWAVKCEEGATENQDLSIEYVWGSDPVTATQVHQVPVTLMTWVEV